MVIPVWHHPAVEEPDTTEEALHEFRTLLYHVRQMYPYYRKALRRMYEADSALSDTLRTKDRRKLSKMIQDTLDTRYRDKLKSLTVYQGQILVKMVERHTGSSMHDLIKAYRTGFAAWKWNNLSRLLGYDLKTGYDPAEHVFLERIMQAYEP